MAMAMDTHMATATVSQHACRAPTSHTSRATAHRRTAMFALGLKGCTTSSVAMSAASAPVMKGEGSDQAQRGSAKHELVGVELRRRGSGSHAGSGRLL